MFSQSFFQAVCLLPCRHFVMAVIGIAALASKAPGGFFAASIYPAGYSPVSVAVGDFNGDGHLDLVVGNWRIPNPGPYTVSILLGNGDGTFQAPQSYTVGTPPSSLAVGDFNGDGYLDIVVVSTESDSLRILLGKGDGTFQMAQSYQAGYHPVAVAVGDFNGDGNLDLAVSNSTRDANNDPCTLAVLLGNGNGTFQTAVEYNAGPGDFAWSVVVADFNHDGNLDLAMVSWASTGFTVLLGNGDGTFQFAKNYATGGNQPTGVAVGDFNGDGNPDVAVVNYIGGQYVSILLGNGDGTFQAPQSFAYLPAADSPAGSITVGDFNGDGHLDVVVTGTWGLGIGLIIFFGNGDGTLQAAQDYAGGVGGGGLAVGDFNGDGILDLVTTNAPDRSLLGTVYIVLGKGHGVRDARTYPPGSAMTVADFNEDGIPDIAAAAPFPAGGTILLGTGDGTFKATGSFPAGGPLALAVADLNGDGKADIVTANYDYTVDPRTGVISILESDVRVFLGNGDGTFQAPHKYATGRGPDSVAIADLNGDGIPNLIVANGAIGPRATDNTVTVLLGNGDGTFQAAQNYPAGWHPQSAAVGDFNGDGYPDIVVANPSAGTVSVLLGNGDGTFQPLQTYTAGPNPMAVAVADLNGDGALDLAVASSSDGVNILLGKGDGSFAPPQNYAAGTRATYPIAVADFNADGKLELAVANSGEASVSILLGNGDGSFQAPLRYASAPASSLVVADLNHDGWPDLVAGVSVLLNAADWGAGP